MKFTTLSWLIIEEDDAWSAQCLEYDIATQAKSYNGLITEIGRQITIYASMADLCKQKAMHQFNPAPQALIDRFNAVKALTPPTEAKALEES